MAQLKSDAPRAPKIIRTREEGDTSVRPHKVGGHLTVA